MSIIKDIADTFKNCCNYKTINGLSDIKLRNKINGIKLTDVIYYRFMYTNKSTTKQEIVSNVNNINDSNFTRQAFDSKDINISVKFYEHLFNQIKMLYGKVSSPNKDDTILANNTILSIDGTYNTCLDRKPMLNLGIFNVSQDIPVDISYSGNQNRNKEVKAFLSYVKNNINEFKNVIFVADRAYFKYDLLKFLIDNNLKFVIRVKGSGNNLNSKHKIKKYSMKYDTIKEVRKYTRIIKCKKTYEKTVNACKSKKFIKKIKIKIKNDCILVTNLNNKYSNKIILDIYKSRWDVEVFFKHIKYNFKFQNLNEKNINQHKKMYFCELILMYIVRLIENYYLKNNKNKNNKDSQYINKINRSNLIKGIFNSLLYDIINNSVNNEKSYNSINRYIIINKNKIGRSFPRSSKTPFTKWYIKGYSEMTKYAKIVDAIKNNTVDKLNKNLKTLAKRIKIK